MSARDFESIGVPPPRRTLFDAPRQGAGAMAYSSSPRTPHAPAARAGSARSARTTKAVDPPEPTMPGAVGDTKGVILQEHKAEVLDMLQEASALLKNVYRSKFVLGDALKDVDPGFAGDAVGEFNLTTPPSFEPAYTVRSTEEAAEATAKNAAGDGNGADESTRERLRTAEELIKKLYRRNTQLEIENKYVKAEIAKLERLQGLSRTNSHNLSVTDGHVPLDHPLYTRKNRRNCRSVPPQRTLLRSAVGGYGLTFPARAGPQRTEPAPKPDPIPVAQLKKRVLQLTEALVSVQHDNAQLQRERDERHGFRESVLRRYFEERDAQVASLNALLQDLVAKVNNPMKLARSKQPSLSINPVVAHQNVIREMSRKLADSIGALTGEIVKTASAALPAGSETKPDAIGTPTRHDAELSSEPREAGARRKELSRRLRALVDTLPVAKRKQLLLLLSELRELYQALAAHNRCLLSVHDEHKARTQAEAVQLKMQIALLRDQLRAMGAAEDVLMRTAVQGPKFE